MLRQKFPNTLLGLIRHYGIGHPTNGYGSCEGSTRIATTGGSAGRFTRCAGFARWRVIGIKIG